MQIENIGIYHPHKLVQTEHPSGFSGEMLALQRFLADSGLIVETNTCNTKVLLLSCFKEQQGYDYSQLMRGLKQAKLIVWLANDPEFYEVIPPFVQECSKGKLITGYCSNNKALLDNEFCYYLPIWEMQFAHLPKQITSAFTSNLDLCYIGNSRSAYRAKRLEYIAKSIQNKACGKVRLEGWGSLPAMGHLDARKPQAKSTIVVGDESYSQLGTRPHRLLQGWASGMVTYYDGNLFKAENRILEGACKVYGPLSLKRAITKLYSRSYFTSIVNEQYAELRKGLAILDNLPIMGKLLYYAQHH